MIFTEPVFVIFFLVVWGLYLVFRQRTVRHVLLLVSSCFFYAWWDYRFLGLMWTVIFVSYFAARLIEARPRQGKLIVGVSVAMLLCLLGTFKYFNFFLLSFLWMTGHLGLHLKTTTASIILPIGISFYIFHGISYIVDVYRREIPAQKSLLLVALYISFFPQLVAGPILRASNFIPQMHQDIHLGEQQIVLGLRDFILGFIYKCAFADNLAQFADPIFANLGAYHNLSIVCAALAFYAQIYFDFAGYSQMAIGLARMMGYQFPENFNHPYQSTSVTEFWRRWHISLSTWLRDYLYIPLGGSRRGTIRQYVNLMVTMLLGGLWHGASWNFVLWGGLHGSALCLNKICGLSKLVRSPDMLVALRPGAWFLTQLFVLLCWVPFRLPRFDQTLQVFSAFIGTRHGAALHQANIPWALLLLPLVVDTLLPIIFRSRLPQGAGLRPVPLRALTVCFVFGLLFALALTLMPLNVKTFIYFKF